MAKESKKYQQTPADLPQRPGAWHLTVRKLSGWIEIEADRPRHPYLALVADPKSEQILEYELTHEEPTAEDVRKLLWKAMLSPAAELRRPPHRPQALVCDQNSFAARLTAPLGEIGVTVAYQPEDPLLDGLVQFIEEELGEASQNQGLLSIPGADPNLVGDLFTAAAEAYRQEPWIYLNTEQPLKFRIPSLNKEGYLLVLGNSAVEYGLILFDHWEELERAYLNSGDPRPTMPENGWVGLSYVTEELLASEDLEAIAQYGWPVVDPEAYPMPMVMFEDRVERPDLETLAAFTALLRALPPFAAQLEPDLDGDYSPLTCEASFLVNSNPIQVALTYPAGHLRRESFPAAVSPSDFSGGIEDAESEEDSAQSSLFLEPDFLNLTADLQDDEVEETLADWQNSPLAAGRPDLIEAMEFVYDAWDLPNPAEIIQLARRAIELCPDCAEAYLLLAENLAVNIGQAYKYVQKAAAAAERVLGDEFIREHHGKLWQEVAARPYLRSLAELYRVLWELGRRSEALQVCFKLLELDREDHVWARYGALQLLLELDSWEEADQLVKDIPVDQSPWKYTQALITFQQHGATPEAQAFLVAAVGANPYVPDYLIGRKRLPADVPETARAGDPQEAVAYAFGFINYWRRVPGAIDWLRKETRRESSERNSNPRHARKKTHRRR